MDLRRERLMRSISGAALLLMGLTITFMSMDWAMSLDPRWFSTIYGMLFMIGTALSALALCIVVITRIMGTGPLSVVANADTLQDLGKLMLAFIMVWAYFSYSQFLIIWSGNLPEEIPWYLRRFHGAWRAIGLFLVVFHFAVPFLILLSRNVKRRARTVGMVALWILAVRAVDLFWLVRPEFPQTGFAVHWLDLTLAVGLGGVWLGVFARQLKTRPLLPLGEPEVRQMLAEAARDRRDPKDERKVAEALDLRFERADVVPGVIVRWAIGLGLVSIVAAAVAVWLLVFLRRREESGDPQRPPLYFSAETRQPEGVRLQSKPFDDLRTLREQETEGRGLYGWVDPAAGTVRIPIEAR